MGDYWNARQIAEVCAIGAIPACIAIVRRNWSAAAGCFVLGSFAVLATLSLWFIHFGIALWLLALVISFLKKRPYLLSDDPNRWRIPDDRL
jgi:hypothetical protein